MQQNSLTILISTYKRSKKIEKQIGILSQLIKDKKCVKVEIYDNDASGSLNENVLEYAKNSNGKISYIKNEINYGACISYLNGVVKCRTTWVWMLSDDDPINKEYLDKIIECCQASTDKNIGAIKFSSVLCEYKNENIAGDNLFADILLSSKESFSSMLFISTWLFRRDRINQELQRVVEFGNSECFQLHLALELSRNGGLIRTNSDHCCEWGRPESETHWNQADVYLRIYRSFETVLSRDNLDKLYEILFHKRLTRKNIGYIRWEIKNSKYMGQASSQVHGKNIVRLIEIINRVLGYESKIMDKS